jgi:tetratricopeptide (TPR) repeat protein
MVAGRSDILSAVFLLASLLLALRFAERGGWGAALFSALLFGVALLSKENALAGVAVIPAFLWADSVSQEESAKGVRSVARPVVRFIPLYAGLAAALAGYFVLRSVAGSRLVSSGSEVSPTALSDFFSALGYYLIKSVWPWPHNHHVNVLPSPAVAAAALAAAACLGVAAWRWGRRRRLYAALAILYAAALAPSLATVPQRLLPTLVAERYLYLPSVAVALAAGLAFARLREKNRALAWGAAAIVLAACGAGSFIQSRAWVNEISFWESTAQNPDNASNGNVLVNLGEVYRLAGRYDEAIPVLLKGLGPDVVAKRPTQTTMRLNLSAAYSGRSMRKLEAGDPAGALADAKSAVAALPSAREGAQVDALYFNFHGLALLLKARAQQALTGHPDRESLRQACDSLSRSQQLDPRNPNIARNLAECQKSLAEAERR